jgi:hypothetical protein
MYVRHARIKKTTITKKYHYSVTCVLKTNVATAAWGEEKSTAACRGWEKWCQRIVPDLVGAQWEPHRQ